MNDLTVVYTHTGQNTTLKGADSANCLSKRPRWLGGVAFGGRAIVPKRQSYHHVNWWFVRYYACARAATDVHNMETLYPKLFAFVSTVSIIKAEVDHGDAPLRWKYRPGVAYSA